MLSRNHKKKISACSRLGCGVFDSIFLYLKVKWWLLRLWTWDKGEWISFSAQN